MYTFNILANKLMYLIQLILTVKIRLKIINF